MAALTATDWTIDVQTRNIEGKQKRHRAKLTLATAGSYPSSGIPLPAAGRLGFARNIEHIILMDPFAADVNPIKYDQTNKTLRVFVATATAGASLAELATTVTAGAGGAFIVFVEAVGW